jgi:hypothetical protein
MIPIARYRVAPFGNPRINGHLHLPTAYRSLSRPSSPPRAKASSMRPCLLSFALSCPYTKTLQKYQYPLVALLYKPSKNYQSFGFSIITTVSSSMSMNLNFAFGKVLMSCISFKNKKKEEDNLFLIPNQVQTLHGNFWPVGLFV